MLISASPAAAVIEDLLTLKNGDHPALSASKITSLMMAHQFTEYEPEGHDRRFDLDEVGAFGERTRYAYDGSELGPLVYRVSVNPLKHAEVRDTNGDILRTHAGVDYALDPSDPMFRGGFESAWPISEANADLLADNHGLLVATLKGFVHPGCVRKIVDWIPLGDTSRRAFITEPADPDTLEIVGDGLWLDVPGGGICGMINDQMSS